MKEKKSKKRTIAWIFLILLIIALLALNYIKFFGSPNSNIEEVPVETSTSKAINTALKDIVTNFNQNDKIQEYANQEIVIKATLNQYSIFISYTTDTTITYEFSYDNLNLEISVEDTEENLETFKKVYAILIEAVQERIGNNNNIENEINSFLAGNEIYDGLEVVKTNGLINYRMNITKRIGNEQNIDIDETNTQETQENVSENVDVSGNVSEDVSEDISENAQSESVVEQ